MDLESVVDELFRLRPEEFTAVRDRRAAEALRAGDRELARYVKALRRPTLAAWASNLLVRERPDEAEALTALGEGLREAHRKLDGRQLRELGRRQRVLVAALSRQAGELAAEAGHPVGEDVRREVEDTLHAALADAAAAREWAAGRLARPLAAAAGFPGLAPDAAARLAAPPAPAPPGPAHDGAAGVTDLAQARETRRAAQRHEERDRAQRQAERATRDLRACEEDLARLHDEAGRAERDVRDAQRRLDELTTVLQAARDSERDVQRRLREAEEVVRAARQAAREAETKADRLT
ncbi:hypothetical protein BLA24_05965 [Streptomyces cinnamoneus]|uniref:Uncharacterized protein n=1 Tax=Streptomyces cinnamoneus TaxID=53446 RepID=A0A2G1XNI4_STRCJ|nr:hypothetical protein [Streptomyces cinnamoneus]PHQ52804.1 hypothetical protein BLA24_05965 [Streptomyces cinnamoneus]PPT11906.1 hypothetical protein CYQ11_02440 [Streptomyces cinnamoneus]